MGGMKITIYNFPGGCGKTSIAAELALTLDYQVITNDAYTPLSIILDKDSLLKLKPNQNIPQLSEGFDIIFDLGGYPDKRAVSALKQSDCVIVPTLVETGRLKVTLNSISEIRKFNRNIIVIVNQAEKGDIDIAKKAIPEFPIFEIKKTRAIPNMLTEKKSVHDMVKEGGFKKYHFQAVAKQFDSIVNRIRSEYGKKG